MESVNAINEILISAYSLWHSVFDSCLDIFSLQLSRLLISTHYEQVRVFRISLEPTDRQMILFRRWGGCSDS